MFWGCCCCFCCCLELTQFSRCETTKQRGERSARMISLTLSLSPIEYTYCVNVQNIVRQQRAIPFLLRFKFEIHVNDAPTGNFFPNRMKLNRKSEKRCEMGEKVNEKETARRLNNFFCGVWTFCDFEYSTRYRVLSLFASPCSCIRTSYNTYVFTCEQLNTLKTHSYITLTAPLNL